MDSLYFAGGGEEGGSSEIPQQLPGHGGMAQAIGRGSEDEEVCSETLRVLTLLLFSASNSVTQRHLWAWLKS